MKEVKCLTFEIKKLQTTDDDIVESGELWLKNKEYEVSVWDDKERVYLFDRTEKITKGVKQVGIFKLNSDGKYEIDFNEKSVIDKKCLISSIEANDIVLYSKKDIDNFIRQMLVIKKIEKMIIKNQKKGLVDFYLCHTTNEKGKDIIFTFASRGSSTKESKKEFYNAKLKEYNLTHKRVFLIVDIEQLEYFNKLTLTELPE